MRTFYDNLCTTSCFRNTQTYITMDQGKVLVSFLAGAVLGTVAAILLAPDKGENTRANILDTSGDLFRRFKARYNDTIDNLTSALDSVALKAESEIEDEVKSVPTLDTNFVATDGRNQI